MKLKNNTTSNRSPPIPAIRYTAEGLSNDRSLCRMQAQCRASIVSRDGPRLNNHLPFPTSCWALINPLFLHYLW